MIGRAGGVGGLEEWEGRRAGLVQTPGRPKNVLEGWKEILAELGNIEDRYKLALVLGNLNRVVGNRKLGVKGKTDKISYGGSWEEP